jgi:hypothetical protein
MIRRVFGIAIERYALANHAATQPARRAQITSIPAVPAILNPLPRSDRRALACLRRWLIGGGTAGSTHAPCARRIR